MRQLSTKCKWSDVSKLIFNVCFILNFFFTFKKSMLIICYCLKPEVLPGKLINVYLAVYFHPYILSIDPADT